MKPKLAVVKIGGNVIEDPQQLSEFLTFFAQMPGHKILVHGGGKLATDLAQKLGLETKMIGGRRITDAANLEVITMVYAGLTNKNIVAQLQAKACNAIGLSGADGNTIRAHKRKVKEIDYGYAGDVDGIGATTIGMLLDNALTPVFCAMTHDGLGQLLNTNADTIAAEIAIGMGKTFETTLYYCFEKKGVLSDVSDSDSVIARIDSKTYRSLLEKKKIADGMLPKMENCFHALQHDVARVCIGDLTMVGPDARLFTTIML
jgi:acetylglutamate kinase